MEECEREGEKAYKNIIRIKKGEFSELNGLFCWMSDKVANFFGLAFKRSMGVLGGPKGGESSNIRGTG